MTKLLTQNAAIKYLREICGSMNNYFAQSPKLKTSTFGKPACSGKSRKY